ncbi:MAG: 5-(carboxyamino)imidazole ribonucleotide synthase [Flavobacteriales bacterium]|jgi:5-(carboxyamino)imidazole ribonucleotide synthase|nr:5-(carboxyamino)imidazole ribonucleotide synthase [Flavobacteriales bacterium]
MSQDFYSQDYKIGVLGGGQLGRMLFQASLDLDIHLYFIDPSPEAPCSRVSSHFMVGDLQDFDQVYQFGKDKKIVTIEIEHVNVEALKKLESEGVKVFPQPDLIALIQDKGLQKQFYAENGIPTAPFKFLKNKEDLLEQYDGKSWVQKLRKGGYDGQGVTVLRSEKDLKNAFDASSILEEMVDFETEISVIVAQNEQGEIKSFPVVDMEFSEEANLVEFLFSPAEIDSSIQKRAEEIATSVIKKLGLVGILAVEMFVTKSGDILVNEVAPRPHNSGHQTIEGNKISQYEQHLRAILNLPLGDTSIIKPSVMVNLLGEKGHQGKVFYEGLDETLKMPGVNVHIYGKEETKPYRKMGHITVLANKLEEAKKIARSSKELLKVKTK